MMDWMVLANIFSGWSLEEIKGLSPRERQNWLDLSVSFKKAVART
jgi:hypothetical protein